MNKIECYIIEDLIPLYQEKLTSKQTNKAIEEHIESCENCRNKLHFMESTSEKQKQSSLIETEKSVDYLKKVKNRNRIIIAGILLLLILLSSISEFFIGKNVLAHELRLSATSLFSIDKLKLEGDLIDQNYKLKDVNFKQEGQILHISAKKVKKIPFLDKDYKFSYQYSSDKPFTELDFNKHVIWQEGMLISQEARDFKMDRVEYIGNNFAVINLLNMTDIVQEFGEYTIKLHTSDFPYGLEIKLKDKLPLEDDTEKVQRLRQYGEFFFAMIDNADFVKFTYQLEGSPREKDVYISKDTIVSNDKSDLKELSKIEWGVQYLMDRYNIK